RVLEHSRRRRLRVRLGPVALVLDLVGSLSVERLGLALVAPRLLPDLAPLPAEDDVIHGEPIALARDNRHQPTPFPSFFLLRPRSHANTSPLSKRQSRGPILCAGSP